MIGPKGLPTAEVKRINAAFASAFATADVKEAMARQGNAINVTTPEAAAAYFVSEMDKYARLVKRAGVKLD